VTHDVIVEAVFCNSCDVELLVSCTCGEVLAGSDGDGIEQGYHLGRAFLAGLEQLKWRHLGKFWKDTGSMFSFTSDVTLMHGSCASPECMLCNPPKFVYQEPALRVREHEHANGCQLCYPQDKP
jgi:hypothetical protein